MTPAEFQEKYYLATGKEIDIETAAILIEQSPSRVNKWLIAKIIRMAEPTKWDAMSGTYTQEKQC